MHISIDIGGTNIRVARIKNNKIINKVSNKTACEFNEGLSQIYHLINLVGNPDQIKTLGISIPGIIDNNKGIIKTAVNLPKWTNQPLKKQLRNKLNCQIKIANDVTTAAIGEAQSEQTEDYQEFVYLIWGTGFGGAKVHRIDDQVLIRSFEPGHHYSTLDGKKCSCGQSGCPELTIGGGSLYEKYGEQLFNASKNDSLWQDVVLKATQTVINTLMFHPVKLIVFGGGLICKRKFLLTEIEALMQDKQTIFTQPLLKLSAHKENSALYGCKALFDLDLL